MEVAPDIHRIQSPLGDRFVCIYLLHGSEADLLIDTGLDSTPGEYLLPYLNQIGSSPERLRYVINSHSDFDHIAGNGAVRDMAPQARFLCHRLDQAMVEDLELIIRNRYDEMLEDHGIGETEESRQYMRSQTRVTPMDMTLSGGETIYLGDGWTVDVWHTPGHSRGHLTVYDSRSDSAIICDAALYNAVLRADGEQAFPPTYRYVETYAATIARLQQTAADLLLTSHYPVYRGDEAAAFLAESKVYVERVDDALRQALQRAGSGRTMGQLIEELAPQLGVWPASSNGALSQPLQGHLERLVAYGLVEIQSDGKLKSFRWK
jgi:glyoxylase-like metal-dependent hydrolase (beta-lactamase superfamily II)